MSSRCGCWSTESGGRFFKGSDKDVIDSLAAIEQGYYELSIPLLQEIQEAGLALEVHAKNPDITLSSITSLARARSFGEMTAAEKQAAILAILSKGLVGDIGLKVSTVPVDIQGNGEEAMLTVQLPVELSQAEWDIYKVWRNPQKGAVQIEKEHVLSESPLLTVQHDGQGGHAPGRRPRPGQVGHGPSLPKQGKAEELSAVG